MGCSFVSDSCTTRAFDFCGIGFIPRASRKLKLDGYGKGVKKGVYAKVFFSKIIFITCGRKSPDGRVMARQNAGANNAKRFGCTL